MQKGGARTSGHKVMKMSPQSLGSFTVGQDSASTSEPVKVNIELVPTVTFNQGPSFTSYITKITV